jgi:hypothetical protein
MGVSQNPTTVQVPMGTEIFYSDGRSRLVAEPYDLVKKMLWPPTPEVAPLSSLGPQPQPKAPESQETPVKASEKRGAEPQKTTQKSASDDSRPQTTPAAHSS